MEAFIDGGLGDEESLVEEFVDGGLGDEESLVVLQLGLRL